VDVLPRRKRGFRSPASAQFWLEWRRSGMLLPLLIGALLIVFIGPIAWTTANTPGASLWILFWTLALPPIVALPLGKGFSKPDFWSANLNLPAYVAVRPLATGEMVVIKMKVAALSAAISWLLVVMFLALWLPFRANLEMLTTMRIGLWMVYGHSVFAQYLIAAVFVLAGMLLTWRFLVTGLWIGLAGNHRRFMGSAAIYSFALLAGLIGLTSLVNQDRAFRAWVREDPNRLLAGIEWAVALAVIAKFWLAARSWRDIAPERIRRFLLLWSGGTIALVALAILLWAHGTLSLALTDIADFLPLDVFRLRNLLILVALLIIPFARLGIAPKALAGNRHGGST
jgi:hypothetical protein